MSWKASGAREYKEAHKSHIEAGGGAKEGLEEGKYRMEGGRGKGARNERASMGVSRSRDDYRLRANP